MLLKFRTKNFKSFVDETEFSMCPAPKQKGLDYSIYKTTMKGKVLKGLCSSVLYGPNATGKSNIIGAMDVLRAIVLRGNIRNTEEENVPNPASSILELIPNNQALKAHPVKFLIEFLENDYHIQYSLSIDLGTFLDSDYERAILYESLFVNEEMIFIRNKEERLQIGDVKIIQKHVLKSMSISRQNIIEIVENTLDREELFLTNGFKLAISQEFTSIITNWFTKKFMVIYRSDSMQLMKRFADPKDKAIYIDETLDKAAKLFGIHSNTLGYKISDDDATLKLYSIIDNINTSKNIALAAELFESYGTIRFVNMFPLVIRAFQMGGTLVVDEFDASIHPMALMSIVNAFHNDEINVHHAQLVFNTHNPVFLNSNLFRRDEIKFIERDDEYHNSKLYALSDFKTSGKNGVRLHEDYMKNYFIDQYGAIKNIDFTPIFEELIKEENKE